MYPCLQGLLILSVSLGIHGQDVVGHRSPIKPPTNLGVFFVPGSITTDSATLVCDNIDGAIEYVFRLYKRNLQIAKFKDKLKNCFTTFENLESGTSYNATVSAVIPGNNGIRLLTSESAPYNFKTPKGCQGGQKFTQCSGHCVSSCGNPDPVCPRICTPGCNCLPPAYVWHNNICIPPPLCPPKSVEVQKPKNLRIFPLQTSGSILISWDSLEGAESYIVKVRLSSNRKILLQEKKVSASQNSLLVGGLTPGEEYIFSVGALMKSGAQPPITPDVVGRGLSPFQVKPPLDVSIGDIRDTGFTITWGYNTDARRYSLVIYNEEKNGVLFVDEKLPAGRVDVSGLAPGSTYYVGVAAAKQGYDLGPQSPLIAVTTTGKKDPDVSYLETSITGVFRPPPTTTSTPPTTTAKQTECQKRFNSARQFYLNRPNVTDGPAYPNCDENGLFVTSKCDPNGECYCLDAETGIKKDSSDYGGQGAFIPLNCNKFGDYNVSVRNLHVVELKATEIVIQWTIPLGAFGFTITVSQAGRKVKSLSAVGRSRQAITNLQPGLMYFIKVVAVNNDGASSAPSLVLATTLFVDAPSSLKVIDQRNGQATVSWKRDPLVAYYVTELKLGGKTLSSENTTNVTKTFSGLFPGNQYVISVRAVTSLLNDDTGDYDVYVSEPSTVDVSMTCTIPKVDIILVFDTSNYTGWAGLQKVKDLYAKVVNGLPDINKNTATRIAGVKYFRNTAPLFGFSRFHRKADAVGAIKYLRYNGSPSQRGLAASKTYQYFFSGSPLTSHYKPRTGSLSVVLFFVGGKNKFHQTRDLSTWARHLKKATNVISIGVKGRPGDRRAASKEEMEAIGDEQVWAEEYADLPSLKGNVIHKICSFNKV